MAFTSVTIHMNNRTIYLTILKVINSSFVLKSEVMDAATEMTTINVKKFSVRDKLELILPESNQDIIVERMEGYA